MNIKEIVAKVNDGTIEFEEGHELDPFFDDVEYMDAPTESFIGHKIAGTEIDVYFPENEEVRNMKQAVYDDEKTEEELIDFLHGLDDLELRYDYDTVAFIKDEYGRKEWA